uniref:Cellulose synthase-like protein n=1 Tax=Populus tomentosa TaxID=118781 RepID=L0AUS3_POPTO|nr:cellulose synthase-like protein [Populus tomentosa]
MGKNEYLPLFETRASRGRLLFKLYVLTIFVAICMILVYRVSYLPVEGAVEIWSWIGMFFAELWFSFYWFITQLVRWNPIYRYTFKDRLSQRYEKDLPGVDIFVCTADPEIEPPTMVINTVLSMMAYDYPPEKLSVYLSDDGGSDLTFYAMLEASRFSKHWLPFCKNFKIQPRSPEAYFRTALEPLDDPNKAEEWLFVKKLYIDMKYQIEATTKLGKVPEEIRKEHKGFHEWNFISSRRDHQTILQILIDGTDPQAMDNEGQPLPTLVYLAREKRPQYPHNFKAGAMNALIRVSSRISNSPIILNVDCDMYSNNSYSVRDALCFFMDEEKGREIGYIQYPQAFENITKNDIYCNSLNIEMEVDFPGLDGNGGPLYIGTGCFHRREALCGRRYSNENKVDWKEVNYRKVKESAGVLEEVCRNLASCTYEANTEWGKEMGLKYGCPVEDVITGLSVQCKGWRSMYFIPERKGFLGLAPTTLLQTLVQHKRWSEGDFQILITRHSPFLFGHNRIPLKLQLSYCIYLLWATSWFAVLYYLVVPPLCLLRGISLFPKLSSPWIQSFAYAIFANRAYGLVEFVWSGGTIQGWWNGLRIWVFKRTTSHLFGFFDAIRKLLGFSTSTFVITAKVAEEDVSERYEKEKMEFGVSSPMLNILATLALLNMFSFVGGIKMLIMDVESKVLDLLALQIILCGLLVLINLPIYQGLFFRKDSGRMPNSVTYKSIIVSLLACSIALY